MDSRACLKYNYTKSDSATELRLHIEGDNNCRCCFKAKKCKTKNDKPIMLDAESAIEKYDKAVANGDQIEVVNIRGSEPLNNFNAVKTLMQEIRKRNDRVRFSICTNGLLLPFYAEELINLGLITVNINVNGLDEKIVSKLYDYFEYLGGVYTDEEGAKILISNQLSAIEYLIFKDIQVNVNSVVVEGINDLCVSEMIKKLREIGVTNINVKYPIIEMVSKSKEVKRKDSVRFAVASLNGIDIDLNIIYAIDIFIYDYKDGKVKFIEKREVINFNDKFMNVEHIDKFSALITKIEDCNAVISMSLSDEAKKRFKDSGYEVFISSNKVEDAVKMSAKTMLQDHLKEMLM